MSKTNFLRVKESWILNLESNINTPNNLQRESLYNKHHLLFSLVFVIVHDGLTSRHFASISISLWFHETGDPLVVTAVKQIVHVQAVVIHVVKARGWDILASESKSPPIYDPDIICMSYVLSSLVDELRGRVKCTSRTSQFLCLITFQTGTFHLLP